MTLKSLSMNCFRKFKRLQLTFQVVKKTKQRATHNQYFKEFAALTVSVDKALTCFATHADEVLELFGRYCEESGLDLQQAA
jgi:hypothetical protein